ncbi:hypothetical protein WME76_40575 [Sorangium sp. So ce119]|uniref:hypothetical protein n=1 Tax=Sorangium sp. So ce119 TaxID=3133279 RepID=UPI003F5E5248
MDSIVALDTSDSAVERTPDQWSVPGRVVSDKQERTALVLVSRDLSSIDMHFDELNDSIALGLTFASTPAHQQGDVVLLGSFGPRGTGDLYVFVGMLAGCHHRGKILRYTQVTRFSCPVVASYGRHVHRRDLLGDRQGWGPHEFNYVLPAALTKVPEEAEALSRCLKLQDNSRDS